MLSFLDERPSRVGTTGSVPLARQEDEIPEVSHTVI
jgi:hypothetical protein